VRYSCEFSRMSRGRSARAVPTCLIKRNPSTRNPLQFVQVRLVGALKKVRTPRTSRGLRFGISRRNEQPVKITKHPNARIFSYSFFLIARPGTVQDSASSALQCIPIPWPAPSTSATVTSPESSAKSSASRGAGKVHDTSCNSAVR